MRKLILPIVLLSTSTIVAQPTITQSQVPLVIGDVLTVYPQTYAAPTEGASQTWDYTAFTLTSPATVNLVSPASSGISGLPPTTLCYESGGVYDCYQITTSVMQRTGAGTASYAVIYDNPESVVDYPITFSGNVVDNFHANYTYSGLYPAHRRGTATNSVVGYGTLMLPASVTINNAMLVKSHEVYTDSVNVGSWLVIHYDYTTYNFYAAGYHGTIVTMTSGSSDVDPGSSSGNYKIISGFGGLETIDLSANLEVYPNPAEDYFTITNNSSIDISGFNYSIVNMQGQEVKNGIINGDNLNMNISTMESGLYILNIKGDQFNASKRFIKK